MTALRPYVTRSIGSGPLRPSLFVIVVMILVTAASGARANVGADSGPSRRRIVCGTGIVSAADPSRALANTARLHPDLYRRMLSRKQRNGARLADLSDDRHLFNVYNGITDSYDEITATLAFAGEYVRIWVDTEATNVTPAIVRQLARGLDSATVDGSRNPHQGIIRNDVDVFGPVPLNGWRGDHRTEFLLTDIQDDIVDGDLLGFFNPVDQDPDDPASNDMNVLYIDSKEGLQGGLDELLSTVAHEFQHLLHFARNPGSERFYNEGCSEEASILNGYMDRGNTQFMAGTNIDLFHWSVNSSLVTSDYERAMTFIHYLHEQFGDQFLYDLVGELESEIDRVDWTLQKIGSPLASATVLENFAVANLLKTGPGAAFTYRQPIYPSAVPRITRTTAFPITASDMTYSVERFGTFYLAYSNPTMLAQGIQLRLSSDNAFLPFMAIAILHRDSTTTVRRLGGAGTYTLGDSRPYDSIVLAVVNTAAYTQQIRIVAQPVRLGVKEAEAGGDCSPKLDLFPNPSAGSAVLRFSSESAAPLSLKIFDARGEGVSVVFDGERFEPGMHELTLDARELPSGFYTVRLAQGERTLLRSMVLAR